MTLDEAIKNAEKVEQEQKELAAFYYEHGENRACKACADCAEEHHQLADWLKELKRDRVILERLYFCPIDGKKCNHDCKGCVISEEAGND